MSLDLLPEAIRHERMLRKKRPIVALAAGLALAASVVSFLASSREFSALESNVKQIEKGLQNVKDFGKKYGQATSATIDTELALESMATDTARDRGWALECLDTILRMKGADGKPVLGTEAAEEDGGVYIKNVVVSRLNPFTGVFRNVERSISNWYDDVAGDDEVKPLVAIIQAEIAGPSYKDNERKIDVNSTHAQALKQALLFSSKIFLADDEASKTAIAAKGITGDVLVGMVERSSEDEAAGRVSYTESPGAEAKTIDMKHVKRLAWLREVDMGSGWGKEERKINTPEQIVKIEQSDNPVFDMREYLLVTLRLIYDDGSTKIGAEETAAQ